MIEALTGINFPSWLYSTLPEIDEPGLRAIIDVRQCGPFYTRLASIWLWADVRNPVTSDVDSSQVRKFVARQEVEVA
jgi:hypothetical protein